MKNNDDFIVSPPICFVPESPKLVYDLINEYRAFERSNRRSANYDAFSYIQFHLGKLGIRFRKREDAKSLLVSKWVVAVRNSAMNIISNSEVGFFKGISKSQLKDIAKLSPDPMVIKELPKKLLKIGIVLVYEPSLPSLKADGVAFNYLNRFFVIGISFRYSRLDNFWFTLLHELSHGCLHFDKFEEARTLDFTSIGTDLEEMAANRLAKESFIPRYIWANCPPKYEQTDDSILEFAESQGIHPAIIAGMLQKEQNSYDRYRTIVDAVNTRKLVFNDE